MVVMVTAEDLLRITRAEDLFRGDPLTFKSQYRELAREWHPDKGRRPRATEVFAHVSELYRQFLERLAAGTWEGPHVHAVTDRSGRGRTIPCLCSFPFELGHATFELSDGRLGMRVTKSPDLLLLRDVARHLDPIPPRHVAWIGSSLHNLACYLRHADLAHQNIGPDTFFVSPEHHGGALLGGWWYATKRGRPITRIPSRTFQWLPWEARMRKWASSLTDQELIRATLRELLGNSRRAVPLGLWLKMPATGTAVEMYEGWMAVLQKTFGPRKFVKLELDSKALYNP
jgi:hypothetical protein